MFEIFHLIKETEVSLILSYSFTWLCLDPKMKIN